MRTYFTHYSPPCHHVIVGLNQPCGSENHTAKSRSAQALQHAHILRRAHLLRPVWPAAEYQRGRAHLFRQLLATLSHRNSPPCHRSSTKRTEQHQDAAYDTTISD
jgi:hypothetical protein